MKFSDGQTEFSRVFNFVILGYSRNSRKSDARENSVLQYKPGCCCCFALQYRQGSYGLQKQHTRCTTLPRECSSNRTHLENTSGQRFPIIQRRRMWQLHQPYQLASDACWGTGAAWRHNHTNTGVTTATHCTTAGIHDKAHQEPTIHKQASISTLCWNCQRVTDYRRDLILKFIWSSTLAGYLLT